MPEQSNPNRVEGKMTKKISSFVFAAVLAVGAVACGSSSKGGTTTPAPGAAPAGDGGTAMAPGAANPCAAPTGGTTPAGNPCGK
jgi:hypothetical protein